MKIDSPINSNSFQVIYVHESYIQVKVAEHVLWNGQGGPMVGQGFIVLKQAFFIEGHVVYWIGSTCRYLLVLSSSSSNITIIFFFLIIFGNEHTWERLHPLPSIESGFKIMRKHGHKIGN